jgi:integrase
VRYRDAQGRIQKESTGTADQEEAERFLRGRLEAAEQGQLPVLLTGKNLTFGEWADWYLENRSKPPFRSEKTHAQNINAVKLLRPVFGSVRLPEIAAEQIEAYLKNRLSMGRTVHTKFGVQYRGRLKPATVHQEFRVLRRILNVAVKKHRLSANPFNEVDFPVSLAGTIRKPHYMKATEQERIQFFAPHYLKHVVTIISEMGLRPYKELLTMMKSQVDLDNGVVHIPDSKTPSGVADMPMTELAKQAFQA